MKPFITNNPQICRFCHFASSPKNELDDPIDDYLICRKQHNSHVSSYNHCSAFLHRTFYLSTRQLYLDFNEK